MVPDAAYVEIELRCVALTWGEPSTQESRSVNLSVSARTERRLERLAPQSQELVSPILRYKTSLVIYSILCLACFCTPC